MLKIIQFILNLFIIVIILVVGWEQIFAPPSWWVSIKKIYIDDGVVGQESPGMTIDRTINRTFEARSYTSLRKIDQNNQTDFLVLCRSVRELQMNPTDTFPHDLTLASWFDGDFNNCGPLKEGSYFIEVIFEWTDVLVRRTLTIDSNVFVISSPPPPPVIVEKEKSVVVRPTIVNPTIVKPEVRTVIKPCVPNFFGGGCTYEHYHHYHHGR